jgi:hypothetical protein
MGIKFIFHCRNYKNNDKCDKATYPLQDHISYANEGEDCNICSESFNEKDIKINFGCKDNDHDICLVCFKNRLTYSLENNQFELLDDIYSLKCPKNDCNSYIKERQYFKILVKNFNNNKGKDLYEKYKSIGAEKVVLSNENGVICTINNCNTLSIAPKKFQFIKCSKCVVRIFLNYQKIFCRDCSLILNECQCDEKKENNEEFKEEKDIFYRNHKLDIPKNEEKNQITIKVQNQYHTIDYYPSWTVKDMKILLSNKSDIPYNRIEKIVVQGSFIEENKKMYEFGLSKMSTVVCILKAKVEKIKNKKIDDSKDKKDNLELLGVKRCPSCKAYVGKYLIFILIIRKSRRVQYNEVWC